MFEGKTASGFEYQIPEENVNDMEFIDAINEMDAGAYTAVGKVATLLLGDQKRALYDHVRTPAGKVPIDKVINELRDILSGEGLKK